MGQAGGAGVEPAHRPAGLSDCNQDPVRRWVGPVGSGPARCLRLRQQRLRPDGRDPHRSCQQRHQRSHSPAAAVAFQHRHGGGGEPLSPVASWHEHRRLLYGSAPSRLHQALHPARAPGGRARHRPQGGARDQHPRAVGCGGAATAHLLPGRDPGAHRSHPARHGWAAESGQKRDRGSVDPELGRCHPQLRKTAAWDRPDPARAAGYPGRRRPPPAGGAAQHSGSGPGARGSVPRRGADPRPARAAGRHHQLGPAVHRVVGPLRQARPQVHPQCHRHGQEPRLQPAAARIHPQLRSAQLAAAGGRRAPPAGTARRNHRHPRRGGDRRGAPRDGVHGDGGHQPGAGRAHRALPGTLPRAGSAAGSRRRAAGIPAGLPGPCPLRRGASSDRPGRAPGPCQRRAPAASSARMETH